LKQTHNGHSLNAGNKTKRNKKEKKREKESMMRAATIRVNQSPIGIAYRMNE
jgi:hypothetical protein